MATGAKLYGTDINGTVIVTTNGKTYDVSTTKGTNVTTFSAQANEVAHDPEVSSDDISTFNAQESEITHDPEIISDPVTGSCININTASKDDLMKIIHIKEVRANDLVLLRPFSSVDDLVRISGIGASRISDIKNQGLACVE